MTTIVIDREIGTGFSYAEYGGTVSTTEEGAVDIAAFTAIFFDVFDSFKGRPYHLAGESYAVSELSILKAISHKLRAAICRCMLLKYTSKIKGWRLRTRHLLTSSAY